MNWFPVLASAVAGAAVGVVYLAILHVAVSEVADSPRPGTLLLATLLIRMALALGGLYLVARFAGLAGLAAALAAFLVVRTVAIHRVRTAKPRAKKAGT